MLYLIFSEEGGKKRMTPFMEWNLNCLRAIAELRTPLLDTLMQGVTELGGETLFMLFMLVVFWCMDKNKGYFLMLLCFTGTAVNQMLKITFCIPRPWVLDPSFEIVASARAGATGFSFPSGHTATAFMTATMLSKEYGHLSPWVGIGAYSVATTTGLMRVVHNKHWLSDVLTGAGIGIISTELGYWVADRLFRDRGITHHSTDYTLDMMRRPSFLGIYVGMNIPLSKYDIDEQHEFRTSAGSTAGVEGAYFFTPYVGVGGRVTVTNTQIITDGNVAEDHTFDAVSGYAGAYFSLPLTPRWQIGTKALAGYIHYPRLRLKNMDIGTRDSATFGTGVSATYRATDHYNARFFVDYNLLPSHSRGSREWMSTLAAGLSFAVAI